MSELVKRYDCTDGGKQFCQGCYTMTECAHGDYVAWEDFARLEQECERLRSANEECERDNDALNAASLMLGRDLAAALKQVEGLRKRAQTAEREAAKALKTLKGLDKVARVVSDNSDQVCGELNTAHQLLAKCQEHLHPHRDAVLWGAVVEALRCAPTK